MHVDIDVKYTRKGPEKLEDTQYDIVDVAEAGSLAFLGVVKSSGPVYGNVSCTTGYLMSSSCGCKS
jgi:hypothetical protein